MKILLFLAMDICSQGGESPTRHPRALSAKLPVAALALCALVVCFFSPPIARADDPGTAELGEVTQDRDAYATEMEYRNDYQGEELSRRIETLRRDTLKKLIAQKLILQEFARLGNALPDSYVDGQIETIIKTQFKGDAEGLNRQLAATGQTMEEYRAEIAVMAYMFKQNVDDKVKASSPQETEKQRSALRQAWIDSLWQAACIDFR
jgi:hypothetical protein